MIERWRIIADYPDYEVSDLGRVRRAVDRGSAKAGRILKAHPAPGKGYLVIGLVRDGKRRPFTLHRLVMDAFIGPMPEGRERSHLDGNSANNELSNLAYETKSANNRRKVVHGTAQRGERGTLSKLTEAQVIAIRSALAAGEPKRKIAREFGCGRRTVDHIASGRTWSHVAEQEPSSAQVSRCPAERRKAGGPIHAPSQQEEDDHGDQAV